MNTIQDYFSNAQLSLAAYSNFSAGYDDGSVKTALTATDPLGIFSSDFTTTSAQSFVNQFAVLDQYTDTTWPIGSGFSATVLQDKQTQQIYLAIRGTEPWTPADLGADVNLVTGSLAMKQLISAVNYMLRLQVGVTGQTAQLWVNPLDPNLPPVWSGAMVQGAGSGITLNNFSLTGHSLGGYLGMALGKIFGANTSGVYTYNAPGFYGDISPLDAIASALGLPVQGFATEKTTNLTGSFADIAPSVGTAYGTAVDIFLESNTHSQIALTDSLAVYNLFAQLAPTLNTATDGLQTITDILEAETNIAANTLESTMTALGKLFNVPGAVVTGNAFDTDRNKLYNAIAGFNSIINCAVPPTIKSLVGMSAADLALNAQTDVAYRYALVNANPFVAAGMSYSGFDTHGELDLYSAATGIGNLTDQYLKDRAAYLAELIRYNTVDGLSSTLRDTRYHDLATKTTLTPINAELNRVTSISPASNDGCIAHDRQYGRRVA